MRTRIPNQKEKMLSAAARLFSGHRYHDVRMEDIATEADVGKGTLYRYFHDKEELYFALEDRAARQIQEKFQLALKSEGTIRAKLVAFIASGFEFFDSQPGMIFLVQKAEALRGSESPWHDARMMIYRTTIDLFAQAEATGEFTVRNPELSVHVLWGGCRSILMFGMQPRPEGLAEWIVGNFLTGATVSP